METSNKFMSASCPLPILILLLKSKLITNNILSLFLSLDKLSIIKLFSNSDLRFNISYIFSLCLMKSGYFVLHNSHSIAFFINREYLSFFSLLIQLFF